jgi:hypothetical protein
MSNEGSLDGFSAFDGDALDLDNTGGGVVNDDDDASGYSEDDEEVLPVRQLKRRRRRRRTRRDDDSDDDDDDDEGLSDTEKRERRLRRRSETPPLSGGDDGGDDDDDDDVLLQASQAAAVLMARSQSILAQRRHNEEANAIVPIDDTNKDYAAAAEEEVAAAGVDASDPDVLYDRLRQRWIGGGVSQAELLKQEFDVDLNIEDTDDASARMPTISSMRERFERHMLEVGDCEMDLIKKEASLRYRNVNLSALVRDSPDKFMSLFSNPSDATKERQAVFNTMRLKLDMLFRIATASATSQSIDCGMLASALNYDLFDFLRNSQYDVHRERLKPNIQAFEFFLNIAKEMGLKKVKVSRDQIDIYEPVNWRSRRTVAFQRKFTLNEWLNTVGRGDRNIGMHQTLRGTVGLMQQVESYLEVCQDSRLPWFVPEKSIHGFDNGFIDVDTFTFHAYALNPESVSQRVAAHVHTGYSIDEAWFDESLWRRTTRFYYDASGRRPLGWLFKRGDIELRYPIMARYANKPIEEWPPPPPMHIEMPSFYKILDFQEMTAETQFILLAFIGRLLYNVNQKDKFGVILMLSGATHTGKSTILEIAKNSLFPNKERVGVLGAMFEKEFGLAKIIGADVALMDECEKKIAIPQGTLKSMATGGLVPVPVKYGDPIFTHFLLHLIFSSNEKLPNFGTSTDIFAMARRFLGIPFIKTVTTPDNDLEHNASLDRSRFFVTSMLCYKWMITYLGRSAVKNFAPKQLLDYQEDMIVAVHPLIKYLRRWNAVELWQRPSPWNGSSVELEALRRNYTIGVDELRSDFNDWLKATKLRVESTDDDFLRPALESCDCVIDGSRIYGLRRRFVNGADIMRVENGAAF